jgi:hypothetical protein
VPLGVRSALEQAWFVTNVVPASSLQAGVEAAWVVEYADPEPDPGTDTAKLAVDEPEDERVEEPE